MAIILCNYYPYQYIENHCSFWFLCDKALNYSRITIEHWRHTTQLHDFCTADVGEWWKREPTSELTHVKKFQDPESFLRIIKKTQKRVCLSGVSFFFFWGAPAPTYIHACIHTYTTAESGELHHLVRVEVDFSRLEDTRRRFTAECETSP